MRKILLTLSMVLIALSCSDDDKDTIPNSKLTEYEVDFTIPYEYLPGFKEEGLCVDFSDTQIDSPAIGPTGKRSVVVYSHNNAITAFDRTCPNCWETSDWKLLVMDKGISEVGNTKAECWICKSTYDLATFKPISGPAKGKKLSLVGYQLKEEGNTYRVTNPRYKKK